MKDAYYITGDHFLRCHMQITGAGGSMNWF